MSEESQLAEGVGRDLCSAERKLIEALTAGKYDKARINSKLESSRVEDMQDGGMGSIRFLRPDQRERHFGKALVKAEYVDDDGVPVSIAFNVDDQGDPYELDFWKVDFSPLKRYPEPSQLKFR